MVKTLSFLDEGSYSWLSIDGVFVDKPTHIVNDVGNIIAAGPRR
jgi:hypothetical protein